MGLENLKLASPSFQMRLDFPSATLAFQPVYLASFLLQESLHPWTLAFIPNTGLQPQSRNTFHHTAHGDLIFYL